MMASFNLLKSGEVERTKIFNYVCPHWNQFKIFYSDENIDKYDCWLLSLTKIFEYFIFYSNHSFLGIGYTATSSVGTRNPFAHAIT